MADINIGSDSLLKTAISDNDRALVTDASNGHQVASITLLNFLASVLPDYASLSEVTVRGEKWIGDDGVSRPVYMRTFVGTTPASFTFAGGSGNIKYRFLLGISGGTKDAQLVRGGIEGFGPGTGMYDDDYTYNPSIDGINVWFSHAVPEHFVNKNYVFTFKYTKR